MSRRQHSSSSYSRVATLVFLVPLFPMYTPYHRLVVIGALLASAGACATAIGPFTWVESYKETAIALEQHIQPGDIISVRVREDENLSTPRARVRDDGRITMSLVDDIEVANSTPNQTARRIEDRLRTEKLLTNPHVSVVIEESRPATISVIGAVVRPGSYPLTAGAGVAEALASAGSLSEFAHRDRIFVMRRLPQLTRIRFTYEGLTGQQGAAASFRLRAGDVVVVQ